MIVKYDSSVARQAQAQLQGTATALSGTLDDLSASVAAVCGGWEGDEKLAYQDIQRRWSAAARDIHEILGRITVALGHNTEAVDRMRSQVRAALAG